MGVIQYLLIYIGLVNLAGFAMMGIDKDRARRHKWRIPEATLFLIAGIGGSLGSIIGMYTFRHKTLHLSFKIGMPVIFVLQFAFLLFILFFSPLKFVIL